MRISVPDSFTSIRTRFPLNGWEVDVYSVPITERRQSGADAQKTVAITTGHTWNALIVHPENPLKRHEVHGLPDYRAACWAADKKTKELGPCLP